MLYDLAYLTQHKEGLKEVIKSKHIALDFEAFFSMVEKRNKLLITLEELYAKRNEISSAIEKGDKSLIDEAKEIKVKIQEAKEEYKKADNVCEEQSYLVPNLYDPTTPIGPDDSGNQEIAHWGEPTQFKFTPKTHIELGKDLDLFDLEAGTKTAGFRGYYLKNEGVFLHLGIVNYALRKIVSKGYEPFFPPTMAKEFALLGSGHFPFGKDEVYKIGNPGRLSDGNNEKDSIYLSGTAEVPLLAYFANRTFTEDELPIKVVGFSQCYRSEAGSYGKDTKGLYRVREFTKVEQMIICKDSIEESNAYLEELRGNAEDILKDLRLPYRVLRICSGDMGAGKYKMYDIETWMPSRNAYGETHSDSNLTDWQARRLNIKYVDKQGKRHYAYTLNNTAIASPRILIPIIENYQQNDGSVVVPKVLRNFVGKSKISPK